jgi:outer membrane protein
LATIRSEITGYQAGLTQKLRSGLTVNPALTVTRTADNDLNLTAPSSANVTLNFTLPLLRGRGETVVTAFERSAMLNREAALYGRRHAMSSAVTVTVLAYWDMVAARQSLDIASGTQERASGLLKDAVRLAAGDEIPRSEVKKFETKLLRETAGRIGAQQSLVEARSNLGLAMGLTGAEISLMKSPSDSFQRIDAAGLASVKLAELVAASIAAAARLRSDLLSVDSRMGAARALLVAADDAQKPQVDLTVGVGYNGLVERRAAPAALQALYSNVGGLNVSAAVSYAWPINNRAARGLSMQRLAELEQIQLERQALVDKISSLVEVRLYSLQTAALQLKNATSEVRLQHEVFESEKKKYRFGLTTLLDLFTSESQLTAAQLNEVAARRNLAQALVRVRFETGTLLDQSDEAQAITYSRLVTLPRLPVSREMLQ